MFDRPRPQPVNARRRGHVRRPRTERRPASLAEGYSFFRVMWSLEHTAVCFAAMRMSACGRFCCRSPLQAFLVGDSVAVMRFATGAGDDGAAESLLPGAVFLFISSR